MKTLKLIGIFVLVIHLTTCGQNSRDKTKAIKGWKILTEKNYSISYPNNWELNQSGLMNTKFILFSPLSSEQDQFKENVNLVIQDLTGYNINLDKYVEISESQVMTIITDGHIIESNRMTSEKLDYQKIIYTGKQGIFNLKFEQYYWVVDNMAYVLTLTCEENEFVNYQFEGEKILNSFIFNKN